MTETQPETYTKAFPVSWDQLHRDSKALAWRLADKGPWRRIVTVTRGGMVPACIVARELEVRYVDTVCVVSYDWQDQGEIKVLKAVSDDGPDVLIIDDLVDTGQTASLVRARLVVSEQEQVRCGNWILNTPDARRRSSDKDCGPRRFA